jgi:hypothetical protein
MFMPGAFRIPLAALVIFTYVVRTGAASKLFVLTGDNVEPDAAALRRRQYHECCFA